MANAEMPTLSARLDAEQLAAQFDKSADWHRNFGTCSAAMIYREAANQLREHLTPRYEPIRDDMPDGWYWCEELERDSPPQLLRSYRPLVCNPQDSTFSVDIDVPRVWQRWTIGGWASVTGRVCPIDARPA